MAFLALLQLAHFRSFLIFLQLARCVALLSGSCLVSFRLACCRRPSGRVDDVLAPFVCGIMMVIFEQASLMQRALPAACCRRMMIVLVWSLSPSASCPFVFIEVWALGASQVPFG